MPSRIKLLQFYSTSVNQFAQYIDEVWTDGPAILPSDPFDSASAPGPQARAEAVSKFKEVLVLLEDAFLKNSRGKPFFGGDEMGYIDIVIGAFAGWFKTIEKAFNLKLLDEATTPNLLAWIDAFLAHPAVKDIMPSTDKLLEHYATNILLPAMKLLQL
ncbi:Glutathione S-transferase U18-like protein, partial [Drosera capensis]